jgi:uncharacterized membrane protein
MFIKLYAVALPVFFVIDMIWLGLVAKNFYRNQIWGATLAASVSTITYYVACRMNP